MIEFIDFHQDKLFHQKIKKLYKEAFPLDEQVPYFMLKFLSRRHVDFLGIHDQNEFVGFVYNICYEDIVFIFYLAIDEKKRRQGYGSRVLEALKERYPHCRFVLNIEKVDETSLNFLERLKRKEFYIKNGFYDLGYEVKEAGVIYQMLGYHEEHQIVSENEYLDLLKSYFGSFIYRHIYLQKIREDIL